MMRYIILLICLIFVFGCREVYEPEIENDRTALVIQAFMSDKPGQLSVRINKAAPYDTIDTHIPIGNAEVYLIDDQNKTLRLVYNGSGAYENYEGVAEPGRSYRLRIVSDGYTYESTPQMLPEQFSQDSIYAEEVVQTTYIPSAFGKYYRNDVDGIETYIDLSSSGTELPKCRYDVRVTVLYSYIDYSMGYPPPTVYCWKTINPNVNVNVTSSRFDRSVGIIAKHSISFFGSTIDYYFERNDLKLEGWLMTINKYNMTSETHQYYLKILDQLKASGKIFDPMPSQINGNIKCVSHPDRLAFGFFDVSRYERLYYKYYLNPSGIFLIPKDHFPGFTNEGESVGIPPAFWYY